jgi:hypothetical protein
MSGVDEVCARLRPGYPKLARHLIEALAADARVQCVLVTGSLATGLADRYSDLALSVVVNNADAVAGLLGALPGLIGDLAYLATLTRGPVRVFTAVTVDWLRVDVLLEP